MQHEGTQSGGCLSVYQDPVVLDVPADLDSVEVTEEEEEEKEEEEEEKEEEQEEEEGKVQYIILPPSLSPLSPFLPSSSPLPSSNFETANYHKKLLLFFQSAAQLIEGAVYAVIISIIHGTT